jgi:KUP system potassium uptake protein
MRDNVEHNRTLHEHAVIVTIETVPRPHVPPADRLTMTDLGYRDDGISQITARYGFQDHQDLPEILRAAVREGLECPVEIGEASYFLSKIDLVVTDHPGMAVWRKRLFVATAHLAADPVDSFSLPRRRAVLMGSLIEV